MPSHNHTVNLGGILRTDGSVLGGAGSTYYKPSSISDNPSTSNAGSGQAHTNLPPYLTAYLWQRIS